jgi:MoxR-like ATPase
LTKPVKVPTDDKTIRALARLAAAAGVSFERVSVEHQGTIAPLSTYPAAGFVAPAAALEPALEKGALEVLFPANAKVPAFEMQEILQAAERMRPEGRFVPIDLAAKKAADREKLIAGTAGRYHHVGAVAVLTGTLFRGFQQEDVRRVLASLGHTEANQKTWSEIAVRLSELSLESRAFALREVVEGRPDFEFLPARVDLADPKEKPRALEKTAAKYTALDGVSLVTALLDRLASFRDSPQSTVEIIARLVKQKKLSIDDVRLCFSDHPLRDWVVQRFADSLRDLAQSADIERDRVRAALDRALPFEREEKLVSQALAQLHSWELATRPPLDAVEHTHGAAAIEAAPLSPFDVAPKPRDRTGFVDVAGIPVRMNTDPLRDRSAIPTAEEALLVQTKTTRKNLARLALALRGREGEELKKRFVVYLEGPTSTGKTSLARLYAHLTDSPYRRFNGSQDTEVADLLGRWVGGQMKVQRAQLEKMGAEELQRLAEQYGVESASREDQIAQIFDAQRKPKWVDGPLTRAMKRGEIFVLDEAPNIRSGVLTALNSLLDDDGYVVLDDHDDEVVRPHPNFRLVLTGNPASGYQGRERLGKDLLSRLGGVVPCLALPREELVEILVAKYGEKIPLDHLANLVAVHEAVSNAADEGRLGRQIGGVAFTLRNLDRVCHRFIELRGKGVPDELLMRREAQEIYLDGLGDPDDRAVVSAVLSSAMDAKGLDDFYAHLEVKETRETFIIGDVTVKKLALDHELVPKQNGELLLDQRTKVLLYKIIKMLELGESPALIGDRSTGKTVLSKYVAQIYGQPFRRALMNGDKDASSLIGRYDGKGWRDGIVLKSGRPGSAPGLLLIDEANKGSSNLLERLNSATDDDRMIVLAEKDGDEVKLDPHFKLIWAMNPPDKRYPGGNKLSKAFTNRVTPLWVPPLETRDDVAPIALHAGKRLGLDRAVVESMLDLHYWVKQRYADNKLGKDLRELDKPDFSLRDVLEALNATADATTFTTVRDAFQKAADLVYVRAPSNADNDAITKQIEDLSGEQRRVVWRR